MPDSLMEVGEGAFGGCLAVGAFEIDESNMTYRVERDALMTRTGALVCYPSGNPSRTFEAPDDVVEIARYAFVDCVRLTTVVIPDSVVKIGERAFWGRSGITSLEIPSSVEEIGENAFRSKTRLHVVKGSFAESWARDNLHGYDYL